MTEAEQLELEIQEVYTGPVLSPNPMVRLRGPGPEWTTCNMCKFLVGYAYAKTYWKCSKRGDLTHGAKTDQRKGWQSCGLYEEEEIADL